tara:strand:+ start:2089 stop:3150 length:1062 start_codon:yes stop_codon:yes gene_type:complete
MAYNDTSDSIIINATLTEKGKKLLSRGRFKVAKFALGDDEIDYSLYRPDTRDEADYFPALLNTKIFEAYKNKNKNIQFGLDSHDSGILYLSTEVIEELEPNLHANLEYLPVLKLNNKLSYSPTLRDDRYYVSVNDETTRKVIESVTSFKFLQANNYDTVKIVVESGIDQSPIPPTITNRQEKIIKTFLLDKDFYVYADNRFVSTVVGIQQSSEFLNFTSGEKIINFSTGKESVAISLESEFEYFATYPLKTIQNLLFDEEATTPDTRSYKYSALPGPRGSVSALNIKVDNELKVNSTGTRDSRFTDYGTIDNYLFSEMTTSKFDYIDTTIYLVGGTTNARLQVPIRIIRYAGT